MFDPADGDDNPVGTIVQFVADFIDGFVEQVGLEQDLEVFLILRDEDRAGGCFQITLQEDAAHLAIPEIGPALEKWYIFASHGRLTKAAVGARLKQAPHSPGS